MLTAEHAERMAAPRAPEPQKAPRRRRPWNVLGVSLVAVIVLVNLIGVITSLAPGGTRPAAIASLGLDSSAIDFGSQTVGTTSAVRTLVVANHDRRLAGKIQSVEITGPDPADFVIESTGCDATEIPVGQSCTVGLRFAPKSAAAKAAVLRIDRADHGPLMTVPLNGVGLPRPLRVDQPSVDFGQVAVGATSVTRTVTATNSSGKPLQMMGVTTTGDHPTDFAVQASPAGCAGITLAPNQTCVVSVSLTPTDVGERTASLVFSYDGVGGPLYVQMGGIAANLSLTASPGRLDFGKHRVGAPANLLPVTITPLPQTAVGIANVVVAGPDADQFKVATDGCSGRKLVAPGHCSVVVQFLPSAAGARLAEVAIVRPGETTPTDLVQLTGFAFVPRPPQAELNVSVGHGYAPLAVSFDGSQTNDPNGGVSSWSLDFGDGTAISGTGQPPASIPHTYADVGIFRATLTVTDPFGLTSSATSQVTAHAVPVRRVKS